MMVGVSRNEVGTDLHSNFNHYTEDILRQK
jgi:hypothetical protein